jgi:hypothetical protein
MKTLKTTTNLDISNYVNAQTGEFLAEELSTDISLKIVKDTNLAIVDSKDYFITDSTIINNLIKTKIISNADLVKLLQLATKLKTEYNAIYNHNIPHTLETIATLLDLNYIDTTRFVKKLCKKNIVHKYLTADNILYCLNPYLMRKRKHFDKDLLLLFSTFYKLGSTTRAKARRFK